MKWLVAALALSLSSSIAFAQAGMRKPPPESPSVTLTRMETAITAHDVKGLAKLLHKNVLVHGLWFPDAACTKRFGKQRTIKKAEHAALAQCLSKLEIMSSTRKSSSAQLVTYKPGVELEVAFEEGELYYAGYVHPNPSATPSITVQTFEALRKTGTTNVDKLVAAKLDPEVARRGGSQLAAWLDICLDAQGVPKITVAGATTREIGAIFLAATADWTFDPQILGGKSTTLVCSQSLLTYPAAMAPKIEQLPRTNIPYIEEVDGLGEVGGVEGGVAGEWIPGVGYSNQPPPPPPPPPAPTQNVPPTLLEANRLTGNKLITPDPKTVEEIKKSGKDKIIGSYKLCLDTQGAVTVVKQLKSTGFAAYDTKIQAEMQTWTYKPYAINGKPAPVCTAVTFIYSQK